MEQGTSLETELAKSAVDRFAWRFGPSYRLLACHAALPLVLTPELLNYLRNRFLRGQVPWVAEADLLLSELCNQAGHEQYVMDPAVRNYLLSEMRHDPNLGPARMEEVARLLISYIRQLAHTDPFALRDELRVQRWAAMVFVDDQRETVQREIEMILGKCLSPTDQIEVERLSRVIDMLGPSLPAYQELKEYAAHVTRLVAPPADRGAKPVDQARYGLAAMADLVRNPKVSVLFTTFKVYFEAVFTWLEVMRDYKTLHDLLHELEFQCYNVLEQEALRFPADDMVMDNVMDLSLTLQRIIGDLEKVAERRSLDAGDSSWIQSLVAARDALATAIESQDAGQLRRTLFLLHRVLTVQPTKINVGLRQAARDMRLDSLIQMLTRASEHLESLQLDPDMTSQFRRGLEALDALGRNLTARVLDHDHWQNLDLELRRVEDSVKQDQDLAELEMWWSDLKVMGLDLCGSSSAEWAVNLRKYGDALDKALAARDLPQIKRQFRYYRRQAAERFFQVDTDLRKQCDELAQIGKSLSDVTRLLQ